MATKKSCSDYQAKVLNGDGSMQEATIEEGKEEVIKVASVEDFPKKKTQRSSSGMLRTLQWIGEFKSCYQSEHIHNKSILNMNEYLLFPERCLVPFAAVSACLIYATFALLFFFELL